MIGHCFTPDFTGCEAGKNRKTIGHHIYWPKRDYTTELEKAFRNIPQNIVQMCVCAENKLHKNTWPPEKPTVAEMCIALTVDFEQTANNIENETAKTNYLY